MQLILRYNPERNIDGGAEQVQDHGVEGSVPVHHGEGEVNQLGQTLEEKHRDREVNFVGRFTLNRGCNVASNVYIQKHLKNLT